MAKGLLKAIEHRVGDQLAIEVDGPHGIVIAGNWKGNPVRITVTIDDGDNRNAELLGFFKGD